MAEKRPPRFLDEGSHHRTFWEYCNKEEFRLQKCSACGHVEWPPSFLCSSCLSEDLVWTKLSGKAEIETWCVIERQYDPELVPPWPIIVVELEEGPKFVSNPKGIPHEKLKHGMPVKVAFIDCEDDAGEFKLPVFERA